MRTGPLQIRGSMYRIDRAEFDSQGDMETPPDFLNGELVARISDVMFVSLVSDIQTGGKGTTAPSWSRVIGDSVVMTAQCRDFTDEYFKLITNNRCSAEGDYFNPRAHQAGGLLGKNQYSALIIRDEESPLDFPALYIPFALVEDKGVFAHRGQELTRAAEMMITSVDHDRLHPPFEWGDLTKFEGWGMGE
jgi:hypothetical protein